MEEKKTEPKKVNLQAVCQNVHHSSGFRDEFCPSVFAVAGLLFVLVYFIAKLPVQQILC